MKICIICKKEYMNSAFATHKGRKDGLDPRCRGCKKTKRLNSPGAGIGMNLQRYWPDKTPQEALAAFGDLAEKQNNLCAICNNPETLFDKKLNRVRRLSVDHDHKTKKVRGLLCHNCNSAIGKLKDNVAYMSAAIRYIMRNRNV